MSHFIDETFIMFNTFSKIRLGGVQTLQKSSQTNLEQRKQQFLKNITRIIQNISTDNLIQINCNNQHFIQLYLSLPNCGLKSLNLAIYLTINLQQNLIQTSFSTIQTQKPHKIPTIDQRILLLKFFSKSYSKNFNKFSISLTNGTFKIIRPTVHFCKESFYELLQAKSKQNNLDYFIKIHVKNGVKALKIFLRNLGPQFQDDLNQVEKQKWEKTQQTIYRFIMKSEIQPSFDVSFGSGKYDTMESLRKGEINYTNSMAHKIVTDFYEFDSHVLYLNPRVPLKELKRIYVGEYFSSNDDQLSTLKSRIEPPVNRSGLGLDSKFVYNTIEINESYPIRLKKINIGGFSQINIAEVEFWYLMADNIKSVSPSKDELRLEQQNQNKIKKLSKKVLVFKSNNFKGIQSGRNRITHEMKIVSKFTGSPSIFIPQYFRLGNQKSPFHQYLIMQYLPHLNLSEYTQVHRNSMSLLTKIHIASLIVYALQILKNSSIVHMDLKPSNIIVSKRLIVKLIDFGQSFNRQICDHNFHPAFSNPYGCPQIFSRAGQNQYNQKNDMYSLGVLFFQLLFRKLPFFLPLQKTMEMLKQKTYYDHIYFVPEEEKNYGSWQIIPFLRNTIFRALDQNPDRRPFIIWLNVILKQCMSYLINVQLNSMAQ